MLWPRTAACACLLFLAGAAAAQTQSRTRDCYRGRPLPPCRSFWITEFGLLGRLNALPEPRTTVDPFFRWEVGGMQNRNERTAFGATIVIEADDLGSRYGITPRYRRWLAPSLALDLSAGGLDARRLGLAWAVGHTASVRVVVAAIILFGVRLPDRLWPAADFLVAVLLIGLGASVILRSARGRWHLHLHAHDDGPHFHLHSHAHGVEHAHAHPRGDARRSLGFGLLHGLAGSAAILVLLVAAAPTRTAQLTYFAA